MIAEFYIPVGTKGSVVLLESEASRFERCGQNVERAKQDAIWEKKIRDRKELERQICRAKSTALSREIYAQNKNGMTQKAIAEAHGLSVWRVRQMVFIERHAA